MSSWPQSRSSSLVSEVFVPLLIILSIPIAIYAFGFQLGIAGSEEFQQRLRTTPLAMSMHVSGAGVALLIGGFQFLSRLRAAAINVHRWLGRTYLLAVVAGGIGGLMLSVSADGGLVGRIGFGSLAVLWLYSGWRAYRAIRAGAVAAHRMWMMRNFALTFAAVTLRIYLGLLTGPLGISAEEAYATVAWISWAPNLIVVEWFLLRSRQNPV